MMPALGHSRYKLTVIRFNRLNRFIAKCECGREKEFTVRAYSRAKSCGCENRLRRNENSLRRRKRVKKRMERLHAESLRINRTRSGRLCRKCNKSLPVERYFHHEHCVSTVNYWDMANEFAVVSSTGGSSGW